VLPATITPMRAAPISRIEDARPPLVYEPKFDGWRALAFVDEPGVRLRSRHGKPLEPYFPDLAALLHRHVPPGAVLDGELVIWDQHARQTSFGLLGRRITAGTRLAAECSSHPAHFVCFDILQADGQSLMRQPLRQRRRHLESLLASAPAGLTLCPQTTDMAEATGWMTEWATAGIEGLVIKPANGPYRPGRPGWYKIRTVDTTEAVVAGVTGTLAEPRSVLLGRIDHDGRLRYVGQTLPLASSARRELAPLLVAAREHPWPVPLPAAWQGQLGSPEDLAYEPVEPSLVAEVVADKAYENGRFRHRPRFARIRLEL
jgi:ATP-dependent DNA ligase